MTGTSPTKRTLAEVRNRGWLADVAEYWQPSFAQNNIVAAAKAWADCRDSDSERCLLEAVRQMQRTGPGVRRDLFGVFDIVALGDGEIHGIQCTAMSGRGARILKLLSEGREAVEAWLRCDGRVHVVGWKKYQNKVDRKNWRSSWREITLADFREPAF